VCVCVCVCMHKSVHVQVSRCGCACLSLRGSHGHHSNASLLLQHASAPVVSCGSCACSSAHAHASGHVRKSCGLVCMQAAVRCSLMERACLFPCVEHCASGLTHQPQGRRLQMAATPRRCCVRLPPGAPPLRLPCLTVETHSDHPGLVPVARQARRLAAGGAGRRRPPAPAACRPAPLS